MSPCRTLQWRRPARSMRARASSSMSSERSMPSPRSRSGPEHFQDAAGAGAEIEQRAERPLGQRLADRAPRPPRRRRAACGCGPIARRARGNSPARRRRARARTAVSRSRSRAIIGVLGIEPRDQRTRELGAAAALGQAEERPGAFAEALDQAGLDQQLEVARDARLRLAKDLGEVGDGQFGLGQQHQDAQARFLAGGLERGVEGVECAGGQTALMGNIPSHKDIFIPLNWARSRAAERLPGDKLALGSVRLPP